MNIERELEKRNRRKERLRRKREKWHCYGSAPIIVQVLLFPLKVILKELDERENKRYASLEWDEERAKRVIDDTLLDACYIEDNGNELTFSLYCRFEYPLYGRHVRKRDKEWAAKFCMKTLDYFRNTYQLDGYTKSIEVFNYDEEYVVFKKNMGDAQNL